jgi:hypothetical protein
MFFKGIGVKIIKEKVIKSTRKIQKVKNKIERKKE